jgi:hypothetical protein
MDKIMSARVDESVAALLDTLSRKLGRSKKHILEEALRGYAEHAEDGASVDMLDETWGAWHRNDSPATTVRRARTAFRSSLGRRAP